MGPNMRTTRPAPDRRSDLLSAPHFRQNHTHVIWGRSGAPFHSMAGASAVPGLRPGDLLSREGRVVPGGQADLCRMSRSDRMPQLRVAPRRAVRRVGWHERTGTSTPEAHGVLSDGEGVNDAS